MKLIRKAVVAASLALGACATITAAPAGPYKVGQGYTVQLGRAWNDVSATVFPRAKKVRLLSMDGVLLNRLYLVDGLAPGEFMVKPLVKEMPTPTYREGMAPTELVEFVVDSVAALEFQRTESANLRPAKFGAADAIRFDLTAMTKEGLAVGGTATVAETNGKLYVILYLAPQEHYFSALLPEVEKVMSSASVS